MWRFELRFCGVLVLGSRAKGPGVGYVAFVFSALVIIKLMSVRRTAPVGGGSCATETGSL
jgi:hypothetical protein